jgi:hypothetical protein
MESRPRPLQSDANGLGLLLDSHLCQNKPLTWNLEENQVNKRFDNKPFIRWILDSHLLVRLSLILTTAWSLQLPERALASEAKEPKVLTLAQDRLSFSYDSQDGEIVMPCRHSFLPHSQDWALECASADRPNDIKKFTVHLVIKIYHRNQSPKMAYQILYWVIDQQVRSVEPGKYLGTTMWMNFDEPSQLTSLQMGQDVQNIFSLNMKLNLKP